MAIELFINNSCIRYIHIQGLKDENVNNYVIHNLYKVILLWLYFIIIWEWINRFIQEIYVGMYMNWNLIYWLILFDYSYLSIQSSICIIISISSLYSSYSLFLSISHHHSHFHDYFHFSSYYFHFISDYSYLSFYSLHYGKKENKKSNISPCS